MTEFCTLSRLTIFGFGVGTEVVPVFVGVTVLANEVPLSTGAVSVEARKVGVIGLAGSRRVPS